MEPQPTGTAPEGEEQESTERVINEMHDDTERLQVHPTQMDEFSKGSPTMDTTGHNSFIDSHATNQDSSDGLEDIISNDEDSMQDLIESPTQWNKITFKWQSSRIHRPTQKLLNQENDKLVLLHSSISSIAVCFRVTLAVQSTYNKLQCKVEDEIKHHQATLQMYDKLIE